MRQRTSVRTFDFPAAAREVAAPNLLGRSRMSAIGLFGGGV